MNSQDQFQPASVSSKAPRLLSVVVIGLNEQERLAGALEAVLSNKPSGLQTEVLYVDSGSTDRSLDIANGIEGVKVLQLAGSRRSAALARNVGLRQASGAFVQLLDGDSLIQPGWMDAGLEILERESDVACVFGHCVEMFPEQSVYMKVCGRDWHIPPGDHRLCGGNALWRTDVLAEYGYFDDSLTSGEEPELCYRVRHGGWRIVCIDRPMVLHDLGMRTFGQYWKRAENTGKGYVTVASRFWRNRERLWLREVLINFSEPSIWVVFLLIGIGEGSPLVGFYLLFTWWFLRTAQIMYSTRRRKLKLIDRVIYAIHAQFSRLPMAVGQAKAIFRAR